MVDRPYTAGDVAGRLGLSVDYFRRRYAALVQEGMPPAMTATGHKKFDRAGMDAWLGRHHPLAPRSAAANDGFLPPPPAVTDHEWREHLAGVYGKK
jgi:hypothetical protein